MKKYVVGFHRQNGSLGKRTVKANDAAEAKARVAAKVSNTFWHFILMEVT
tara:strand:- start:131 stop:280 length:150 start_codon:yes stop_codon:yes gene_type:complete